MSNPLDFKVVRGNPTPEELHAIEIALISAKNSSGELLKQKSKVSNWNNPNLKFRTSPLLDSGWQFSKTSGV